MSRRLVYVTGLPAVGKTSFTAGVRAASPEPVEVISYGDLLLSLRGGGETLEELRRSPADLVDEALVRRADSELRRLAGEFPGIVLVESHAVTVERYGFRAIPFTAGQLDGLGITDVFMLFDEPGAIRERTERDPAGRPVLSESQISFGQNLQASIAFEYAMREGVPLHCLDMGQPGQVERALSILGLASA